MDLELIRRARDYAIEAHGDQKRKYTGEPYWHHCQAVAQTMIRYSADSATIAAAWLHDTIEDTPVTYLGLVTEFGYEIADLVLEVSNVSRRIHGTRVMRKRLDLQYIAGASWRGQMIKCGDIDHNIPSIVEHDLDFAQTYVPEKRVMMERMTSIRNACFPIWDLAYKTVRKGERDIGERLANAA